MTEKITNTISNPKKEITSIRHGDEKLLTESIHRVFVDNAQQGKCVDVNQAFEFIRISTRSNLRIAKDIALSSSASSAQMEARIRCRNPRSPVGSSNPKEYSYYFCVEFEGLPDENTEDSFLGSEISFAEVTLEMRNFMTKQGVSCEEFQKQQNSDEVGLLVYYSLYWSSRKNGKYQSYKKNGGYQAYSKEYFLPPRYDKG